MNVTVIDTLGEWADAVAALPAAGPLPSRTVLVPSERHAHALRRELAASGRQGVLAGTRFAGAVTLAIDVLRSAGIPFTPGEDALRPARLLAVFEEAPALEYFDLALIRRGGGWSGAFAQAIATLEGAGLTPAQLPATSPQWRDLAALWRRLDAAAGGSLTTARILREAAARLAAGAKIGEGPALAVVTGHERAVHAAFVRAIPGVRLAVVGAQPVGARHLEQVEALYGAEARRALSARGSTGSPRATAGGSPRTTAAGSPRVDGARTPRAEATTELELLQAYLFAAPEVLADPDRPRSAGRDGTVELEEHAGVEEELEAAADWVAREVLERQTPLERIAVLVPVRDPLAGLAAERLARLPWAGGALPVHVAGGLPVTVAAGGARVLSVVRALSSWLSAGAIAAVLPSLRAPVGDRQHLTHGEASELAWSLGTIGGAAAHPAGALEWTGRAAAREEELAAALAEAERDEATDDRATWHLEGQLARLRAARPALAALVEVARRLVGGAPLSELGPALAGFVRAWVLDPADGAPLTPRLADAFEEAGGGELGALLRGEDALTVLEGIVRSGRVAAGRFGEPAVFVGSVADAAGLEFDAVRVLGLCEGSVPPAVREDPVLPDAMRAEADARAVPTSRDRVLQHLQAFARVVSGARGRFVLSAPRVNLERTEREPSSVFVEVGAALARPPASGERSPIPDLQALRRDAFVPARAAAAGFRAGAPVGEAAWLGRAATAREIPPGWTGDDRFDLARIEHLRGPHPLGVADGILGADTAVPPLPGVTAARPISASALQDLLRCPRAFLYQRVLRWSEPDGEPSLRELDPLSYGGLFHGAMEDFYRAHGRAFVAHQRTLRHWEHLAAQLAGERFDVFLHTYPLAGDGLRRKELGRLLDDVRALLRYDWDLPGERTFVDVERAFGVDAPVALEAGGRTLYLRGYIDRLDVEGDHTLVRDLKTGGAHPRTGDEAGPTAGRDLQLAVYGLVVKQLAAEWGLPPRIQAAYVYPNHRGEPERAFREDHAELERAGAGWLALAARMLHERVFPPTPVAGDCTFCPMRPLCGAETPARAAEQLEDATGTLGLFRDFKIAPEDEE
ncbi:PD-(D/E)XK nuclease family protein [Anaeromyxobacter sp. Red801]|uniref:PD-(D/E)XK nuclease family protein n=1 Tax=Anaeromyxobacter sp. Red801 TaxID=3411632 RepID=UPI003BA0A5C2